ncbi:MAG: murein L,D-transpeptidase catalytic domain family protein [Chitinophagaceae bacterium]|nr:murein L,D-transpeptidase catalytic domain family protein [Chitinophagaceae bacterium]MBN8666297.1 murein L,D-transpeptidase catalytic domain family protein [Chitinophagales bacterium]
MSKLIHLFILTGLSAITTVVPQLRAGSRPLHSYSVEAPIARTTTLAEKAQFLFDSLDLDQLGLSEEAFQYAYKGYTELVEKGLIRKNGLLTICDFSQSSRNKRLYLVDMENFQVLKNTYVAHGRNSGGEFAKSFSNSPRSHKSSLGFYITSSTYKGGHGLSLRLQGVEKGINDKAMLRHIVIHGSNYVGDKFLDRSPFLGRSFGCPAIPAEETKDIIETIKDGSCLFIYHPSNTYLKTSKILNG